MTGLEAAYWFGYGLAITTGVVGAILIGFIPFIIRHKLWRGAK
jgi:hypothetical protein